ncbi:hypothetical protein PsalN5692_03845 (plasmid) [Piscirickettsia salmonis]|uniref:hypothetical protein n=1 Tax=Piscirickettsia salmonis TaxID=1238 RepID=UPI0012B7402F|nr:hypothetical protein [Piscirickettsia salmonis]QGP52336.1 hypothetical protein PsalN5692_03845 [Piscirickettsia salmonis]
MKKALISTVVLGAITSTSIYAANLEQYCQSKGGTPITMQAQFDTHSGYVNGFKHRFCEFNIDGNLAVIGLKTLSSTEPNIAATYTKKLPAIGDIKHGKYANPSLTVCKRLHGSEITFAVIDGGFADNNGQSDICVFGDGSMISAWTLMYSSRSQYPKYGYSKIKDSINSTPMAIDMPKLPAFKPAKAS